MVETISDHAPDRALADLVDAFGHYSDAEIQAFLDATPFTVEMRRGVSPAEPAGAEWLAGVGLAGRALAVQAARA